jgi:hypothetical protein
VAILTKLVSTAQGRPLPDWISELESLPRRTDGYTMEDLSDYTGMSVKSMREVLRSIIGPVEYIGPYKIHLYSTDELRELGKMYNNGNRYRAETQED